MSFPVIVSYSNDGYYDFAKNMLLNLNKVIQHHPISFYCLDEEIYRKLTALSLPNLTITFHLFTNIREESKLSRSFENYGSADYNKITHTKTTILKEALELFGWIHFIDCDVVCMKEPSMPHYEKYKIFDIVFQHDAGMFSKEKLHAPTLHHIWTCTGNMTLRNTPGTQFVLNKIIEYQDKYKSKNDQECLYQYFLDLSLTDIRRYPQAKLFTYEIEEYTNGYFLAHNIGSLEKTYFFHANHVTGKQNKMNLLKKAGHYYSD